jgi:tetratricopeptide (TPR) repeat protein/tRNA A-37 threonylcarbamoyl transferase component Bud32
VSVDLREQLQTSLGTAYKLERELGGGGMSRTFVAHEAALGRKVVVKILSPELAAGVSVDRFKREIQLAAMLQHPHVVPVLATGDAGGLPWFTMPYVEGESLRARLGHGPLRIGEATGVLRDVARALEFAHSHGVVHRDIKPDNVLLAGSSATVTDFGIAKALSAAREGSSGETLTMAGQSIGTPAYMAPEQAAGDPSLDSRSDIYSFGILAYELLAGRPPFDGAAPAKVIGAHFSETPRDVRELRPDTPPVLAEMVMHCLAKDANDRPQTAADLVRVLETVTSSGAADAAPIVLQHQMKPARALTAWAVSTFVVALTAWAATTVIGLPDWVFPGSLGVMLAGLPAIAITWYVQHTARQAYTTTPTFTPHGSPSRPSTLATMAMKASPHVSWRRTWIGGAVAVASFAALVVGFMVMRAFGIGPAGSLIGAHKLSSQERLIITDFKSPATDSTLGVTVTEALRADLDQSTALHVVSRQSMIATLRLLEKEPNTAMDFDVAREIATREGVKAVLDGGVVSLGGRYVLSARLLSPQDGEQMASFREEAANQNDLIPAIGRLVKQLRSKVGESLKSIHEATALERVTTGSIDALSKYAAALTVFDQTGDYDRTIPLLQQAVAIDSTFAMAWRRLSSDYWVTGRRELAAQAIARAYAYRDRVSEIERGLTVADYFGAGPEIDDERALEAYENVLARDSSHTIALNNASLILVRRRDYDRAETYFLRAASEDKGIPNPITWGNAINWGLQSRGLATTDSVMREWASRAPNQPSQLLWQARLTTFGHRDYDIGEQMYAAIRPRVAVSRTITDQLLIDQSNLMFLRGRLREGFQLRTEARTRQLQRGARISIFQAGLDSANVLSLVEENAVAARAVLGRTLERISPDSFPPVDRPFRQLLAVETYAGDTGGLAAARAGLQRTLAAQGRMIERASLETFADGQVEFARGHFTQAIEKFNEADRQRMPCVECVAAARFLAFDRLGQTDSAINAGEAYLKVDQISNTLNGALNRPGILQRLGELYEAKHVPYKAVPRYEEFIDVWKKADPELQPRVRDVRGRLERLRAEIVRKG